MQIDDILLLRMNRQYLFAPAEDELTVLRDLCGLQSHFTATACTRCVSAAGKRRMRISCAPPPSKRGRCAARCI